MHYTPIPHLLLMERRWKEERTVSGVNSYKHGVAVPTLPYLPYPPQVGGSLSY